MIQIIKTKPKTPKPQNPKTPWVGVFILELRSNGYRCGFSHEPEHGCGGNGIPVRNIIRTKNKKSPDLKLATDKPCTRISKKATSLSQGCPRMRRSRHSLVKRSDSKTTQRGQGFKLSATRLLSWKSSWMRTWIEYWTTLTPSQLSWELSSQLWNFTCMLRGSGTVQTSQRMR